MFANACSIARQFTFPIIISHRNFKGECKSGIGTVVIINDEGWFVTAFHIISQILTLNKLNQEYQQIELQRKAVDDNESLKKHEKMRQLNGPLKINPEAVTNVSVWAVHDGVKIDGTIHGIPEIDLAVGKFTNLNTSIIKAYPQFKDPTKSMVQGTSLCKLGFPFHSIQPTFDPTTGFILPPGSLPIPIFPIEGIFTRHVQIQSQAPTLPPFPLSYIETSSPGLRGQSGGPTFDVNGAIWAIQSQTQHLKLGFGDAQKGKESEYLKNQYLNVGWGIHSETIIGFLTQKNISFTLSPY